MLVKVHICYFPSQLSHHHVILLYIVEERFKLEMLFCLSFEHILNPKLFRLYFLFRMIQLWIRVLSYLHLFSLSHMSHHSFEVIEDIIKLLFNFLCFFETLRLVYQVCICQS